jgi:hypothetical protein
MFIADSIRFSTHPAIAVPHLQPHAYGNIFNDRAKVLLGSMLGVPSRETIIAFILMSHISFANGAFVFLLGPSADGRLGIGSLDVYRLCCAYGVRPGLTPGMSSRFVFRTRLRCQVSAKSSDEPAEESRLNRLVFWSVIIMDHALAFGVGRQTTFRLEDITQTLPSDADLRPNGTAPTLDAPRSAFPHAVKQMWSYGPLINMLNSNHAGQDPAKIELDIQNARALAMVEYNQLPEDMQWNVGK